MDPKLSSENNPSFDPFKKPDYAPSPENKSDPSQNGAPKKRILETLLGKRTPKEIKKPVEEKSIFDKRKGKWLTRNELAREAEKLTQFETKMDREERKKAVIELPKKYGQLIDKTPDIKDWKKELKKEQSYAHAKEGLDLKHKREMFEKLENKKIK